MKVSFQFPCIVYAVSKVAICSLSGDGLDARFSIDISLLVR